MTIYVDSNAGGANNGTDWSNAFLTLQQSTGAAAGENVLVADDHNQVESASVVCNYSNGTHLNPVRVLSVDKTDNSLSPGAIIDATGAAYDITIQGNVLLYGLELLAGDDIATQDADSWMRLEQCVINCDRWSICNVSSDVVREVYGCTVTIGDSIFIHYEGNTLAFSDCVFSWPSTGLFNAVSIESVDITIEDSDLSNQAILFDSSDRFDGLQATIRRCKLHPSFAVFDTSLALTLSVRPTWVLLENCDTGTITDPTLGVKRYEDYFGTAYHTTSVFRTGGADDGEQVNAYSLRMETNANAKKSIVPLQITLGSIWLAPDASPTGATAKGIHTTTRTMLQQTPSALTTDSVSTWNGVGVSTKQKITHTLGNGDTLTVYVASGVTLNTDEFWIEVSEPDQVGGLVTVKAYLAKPSTVVYVDPLIEVV